VLLVALLPPVGNDAGRYAWVEALQFCLIAMAVPALLVLGSPWHLVGLGTVAERLASRRRHQSNLDDRHSAGTGASTSRRGSGPGWMPVTLVVGISIGLEIAWRTPAAVNRLAGDRWLVLAEAATLIPAGVAVWLELVESPPLSPRASRPVRMAVAAISMWAVWILAYVVGLSHSATYRAYVHAPGVGLSAAADQQVTTWVMWFVAACAFIPVVFVNLTEWLRSEDRREPSHWGPGTLS
jgi:cytochrome c oxidase assembly factor CtaG